MLPTRKSMPRSNRQSNHTKTSWPSYRDANCNPFIRSGQDHLARHSERGKKNWEDNIRKWTGLLAKYQRAVENREEWRKLVVKSSVVPKRLSRLMDR